MRLKYQGGELVERRGAAEGRSPLLLTRALVNISYQWIDRQAMNCAVNLPKGISYNWGSSRGGGGRFGSRQFWMNVLIGFGGWILSAKPSGVPCIPPLGWWLLALRWVPTGGFLRIIPNDPCVIWLFGYGATAVWWRPLCEDRLGPESGWYSCLWSRA